jgi:hypothetical protein
VDEETSTIKQRIDNEREQSGSNPDEIENRVKKATDLKAHFDRNTAWILGGAVAGGFLLTRLFHNSSASGHTSRREANATERNMSPAKPRSPSHLSRLSETLDNIFEGLVGVVSNKMHSFVADAVPGFGEEYDAIERQRGRASGLR